MKDGSEKLVHVDPEIMGGAPVFVGTRVPIFMVLGALEAGDTLEELQEDWEFLTEAHLDAAREFAKKYPAPQRRRRLHEIWPELVPAKRQDPGKEDR